MKFCIKNFSPKLRTKFTKWVPQAKRTECVTQPYWSKMLEIPQCYWKSFSNSMKSNFSVFIVTEPICTLSGCLREISHPLSITHADWQLLTELVHYYWICWILISWCYSHYCLQFSASDPSTDCQAHGGTKCQHAEESKGWDNEWCSDPHIWGGCSGPHFESHCCGKYYLFSCSLLWEGRIALLWFFFFLLHDTFVPGNEKPFPYPETAICIFTTFTLNTKSHLGQSYTPAPAEEEAAAEIQLISGKEKRGCWEEQAAVEVGGFACVCVGYFARLLLWTRLISENGAHQVTN